KRRGFPGPVRAKQAHDFTLTDFQFDVINYFASPVGLAEIDALECGHSASRGIAWRSLTNFAYLWTRCLVSVLVPLPESTMIVSSAILKVNSRPVVVPSLAS